MRKLTFFKTFLMILVLFTNINTGFAQSELIKKMMKEKANQGFYYTSYSVAKNASVRLSTYNTRLDANVEMFTVGMMNSSGIADKEFAELISVGNDVLINPQLSISEGQTDGKERYNMSSATDMLIFKDNKIIVLAARGDVFDRENFSDLKEENLKIFITGMFSNTDLGDFKNVLSEDAKNGIIKKYKKDIFVGLNTAIKSFAKEFVKTDAKMDLYRRVKATNQAILKNILSNTAYQTDVKYIKNYENTQNNENSAQAKKDFLVEFQSKLDNKIYGNTNTMFKEFYQKGRKYEFMSVSYIGAVNDYKKYYWVENMKLTPTLDPIYSETNPTEIIGLDIGFNEDGNPGENRIVENPQLTKSKTNFKKGFVQNIIYRSAKDEEGNMRVVDEAFMYKGYLFVRHLKRFSKKKEYSWFAIKVAGNNNIEKRKENIYLDEILDEYNKHTQYSTE